MEENYEIIRIDNALKHLENVSALSVNDMENFIFSLWQDNTIWITNKINYELRINKEILTDELLSRILNKLGENAKIKAYNLHSFNNDALYKIVIESDLDSLKTDISKEFETELGNINNIIPMYWRFFFEDSKTRYYFVQRIMNKLSLSYTKDRTFFEKEEKIHIPYNKYMDEKKGLKVYIDGYILDPPSQQIKEFNELLN